MNSNDDYEASGLAGLISDAQRRTRRYVNDLTDDANQTNAAIGEAEMAIRQVYDSMGRLMGECAPVLMRRLNAYVPSLSPPIPLAVEELDRQSGLIQAPEYQPTADDIARVANDLTQGEGMPRVLRGPLSRRLAG